MDNIFAAGQMETSTIAIIVTTMCSTLAGLVVSILAYARESRAHRWQVEQAAIERQERQHLAGKIDENTEISVRAFEEANGVNRKIQAIGEMRLNKDAIGKASESTKG